MPRHATQGYFARISGPSSPSAVAKSIGCSCSLTRTFPISSAMGIQPRIRTGVISLFEGFSSSAAMFIYAPLLGTCKYKTYEIRAWYSRANTTVALVSSKTQFEPPTNTEQP